LDTFSVLNNETGESVSVPISSVPTTPGSTISDALSVGFFELTLGPETGSQYSPDVLTISGGTLVSGDSLNSRGTTENNNVPWRAHDTNFFGSLGCLVGQSDNENGSIQTIIEKIFEWGAKFGDSINGMLTEYDEIDTDREKKEALK